MAGGPVSPFFSKLLSRMRPPEAPAEPDPATDEWERDAFAHRVRTILGVVGVQAEYDPAQFALRLGPAGSTSWLGNRFEEYRRAPEEDREGVVLHVVQGIVEASRPSPVEAPFERAREHLRPRIRQRAHLVILRLQMEADGLDPRGLLHTFVPITTDLGAEIVYDTPANIVSVPGDRLRAWGVGAREALRIAVDNLRRSAPEPFQRVGDGIFAAVEGDCYDSARLLLTDEIARLPLAGEPVALPANRDTLPVTGSEDKGGLYRLLELAMEALERPRMDTLQPVVLRGGRWQDWHPPEGHPMRDAFYELAVRTRGTSYAELKSLVEQRHERDGTDLFVASYGVFRAAEDELPRSHAIWPPVRGWLPEADLVSVVHPDEQRYVVVPREALVVVAGHLLDPVPGLHPPYEAFDGAPDARLWERLQAHAVREGVMGPSR